MSDFLASLQVLIGAATLVVTILFGLQRENPPSGGGHSNQNED